jgi:hypothetical protein
MEAYKEKPFIGSRSAEATINDLDRKKKKKRSVEEM